MNLLEHYFPTLSPQQKEQFEKLETAISSWNEKINLISRKDIDQFEERHLLHSLAITKFISFHKGCRILDVGTGGGFPGLPLAIYFPECHFTLLDSTGKKIMVVEAVAEEIGLKNVRAIHSRVEDRKDRYDFIVSRAVTAFPKFYTWTKKLVSPVSRNDLKNGIIYLKGGDLKEELSGFASRIIYEPLDQWYSEEFFKTKGIVYLPFGKGK